LRIGDYEAIASGTRVLKARIMANQDLLLETPSLDALLKETMLGKIAPNPQWRYTWSPLPLTEPSPNLDADEEFVYRSNPIWRFDSPTFTGAGVQVKNLTCKVRSMDYMKMRALNLIEWGPVVIRSTECGGSINLPLTEEFLLRNRYVKEGFFGGSSDGYWQLPASVDQSFELVFGYELPLTGPTSAPMPMSFADLSSDRFMPHTAAVFHTDPAKDTLCTLRTPTFRVIVVVSLVCCKERYDFVPGNVLGAGRIYPLVMIVANSPLVQAVGSVKVTRPQQSAHTHIMGEEMTSAIGSAFFTDRNDPGYTGRPLWSNIFDYYYIDPPPGKYTLVTPSDRGQERTIRGGVTVHERTSGWGDEGTSDRDVRKLPGQGEFDNLHMAPKMVFPRQVRESEWNSGLRGLDAIAMAPFCVHDCFHMHVRWSNKFDDNYNKGWVGQKPYAAAGAPLVPGNQSVSLELLSPVSFLYTATAMNPDPGQWQIIMHHGGAYAISINTLGNLAKDAVETLTPVVLRIALSDSGCDWATFYWWLRYDRTLTGNSRQFERLTWTPAQFVALRGISAASAGSP
jgi:hypothetical protein